MKVLTVIQPSGEVVIDNPTEFIKNISENMKVGQFLTIGCMEITEKQWEDASTTKQAESETSQFFKQKICGVQTEMRLKNPHIKWEGEEVYNKGSR